MKRGRGHAEDDGDYGWAAPDDDDDDRLEEPQFADRDEDDARGDAPQSPKEIQRATEERAQLVPYVEVASHIRGARRTEHLMGDARWRYAFYSNICRHYLSATKGVKLPAIEREGEERRVPTAKYDFK